MIYIYRRKPTQSGQDLAHTLKAMRVRRGAMRIRRLWKRGQWRRSRIVGWGEEINGVVCPTLNGQRLKNKLTDVVLLKRHNIPTIDVAMTKPGEGEWLGRRLSHIGGRDFFNPPVRPDFWVKKEDIVKEYRVHSFKGRSLRAGVKIPRVGMEPHPWIRSHEGGWRISYNGKVRQRHRDLAHAAITALGLDFGAVDIAQRRDKSLFVLEVNRAPGLEGGTLDAYARAVEEWANDN